MKHVLDLRYAFGGRLLAHTEAVLLLGSCFTRHVGEALQERMFRVLHNPTGILFDPSAVARHLMMLLNGHPPPPEPLVFLNDVWHSWEFHSRFSHPDPQKAHDLQTAAVEEGHEFLKKAETIILTFGSAYRYLRRDTRQPVANNHRAPAPEFERELPTVDEMYPEISSALSQIRRQNPGLQVLLTVSPVRHARDGLIENNQSKARLIELVHRLCANLEGVHYFPSYEWVIDVLRDHRWYDVDLIHPNHAATREVIELFVAHCLTPQARDLSEQALRFTLAARHRPRFPETPAHRRFVGQQQREREIFLSEHPELTWYPPNPNPDPDQKATPEDGE